MSSVVFEPFTDTAPYRYTGPFDENVQMLVDLFCASEGGAVTIHTDDGQTIYQHRAVYSSEEINDQL